MSPIGGNSAATKHTTSSSLMKKGSSGSSDSQMQSTNTMDGRNFDYFMEDFDSQGLRELNSNTIPDDEDMDYELNRFAQFASQKSKHSDRFIPHRVENAEFSQNFEVKHLIFNPDLQGSITSPYEIGSNNRNSNLQNLIDGGFSEASTQSPTQNAN